GNRRWLFILDILSGWCFVWRFGDRRLFGRRQHVYQWVFGAISFQVGHIRDSTAGHALVGHVPFSNRINLLSLVNALSFYGGRVIGFGQLHGRFWFGGGL